MARLEVALVPMEAVGREEAGVVVDEEEVEEEVGESGLQ
jgi:hypothetical protein